MAATGQPIRFTLDWGPDLSLSVFNLGLACCAVEVVAASMRRPDLLTTEPPGGARRHVDVLVVSGTVTDQLAPSVLELYADFDPPPYVMSFGACSNSGGPYWDSYSVTKGVDQLIPVDVYVPGCPPRPEAFVAALHDLRDRVLR
ncbi:MAG: NADH-quinone oxidoreductase subunit [Actinomycetota bacterium]|jgi:NADH-quinone oxidoreductase subunit B|nr:NADH-quinone oxidoreductase subunit [Actinomycetota bacterium]